MVDALLVEEQTAIPNAAGLICSPSPPPLTQRPLRERQSSSENYPVISREPSH